MPKTFHLLFVSALAAALALVSCSTIPRITSPTGVDVSVTAMTSNEVRTYYGTNSQGDPNPFIPPGGLLSHQTQDYVVVRFQIASARKAVITIDGIQATDSSGNTVADPYSWDQFKSNLAKWYQAGRDTQIRYTRAERAYIPGNSFDVRPGRVNYVVVLVGKHPMPEPVEVKVGVTVGLEAPRLFSFQAKPISTGGIF